MVNHYSIKDLETLCGIKAHTLRVWEQRYGIISPKRTDTNIRYYDENDLKLLLNISLLNDNGYKISKIACMSIEDMYRQVNDITENKLKFPEQIQALTLAMVDMDETRFEKTMSRNILQFGFEKTMANIVIPFLVKIGVMWQTGTINPCQEHFISSLIKQKLYVAIDGQYTNNSDDAKKFLLFLPEGEFHELMLLFSDYLIRARQHKTMYLGQSTPFEDLKEVAAEHNPDCIVTFFTSSRTRQEVQSYIHAMGEVFSDKDIVLSGSMVAGQDLTIGKNMFVANKIDELVQYLENY